MPPVALAFHLVRTPFVQRAQSRRETMTVMDADIGPLGFCPIDSRCF